MDLACFHAVGGVERTAPIRFPGSALVFDLRVIGRVFRVLRPLFSEVGSEMNCKFVPTVRILNFQALPSGCILLSPFKKTGGIDPVTWESAPQHCRRRNTC